MARITRMDSTRTRKRIGLMYIAIFLLAGFCFGQAASSLSFSSGRPTTHVLTNWNQFHRRNMARFNPYEKFLTVNNVRNLGLKWSHATSDGLFSSPTILNSVVYVTQDDYNVYALDAHTGAKLWSNTIGNVESSPAVVNGVVYVGSDDNNLYALDARTGAKLWSYTTGGRVYSSPTVANGIVYVGSGDCNVYALNARTGAKLWSYTTGYDVESSPAVANGVVYVGSRDYNVYG
jgi:outer membrane protein assembly factor BamB